MRLNDGLPVWHASLSLWTPAERKMSTPGRLERLATMLLAWVGGDVEWWIYNPCLRIGHLRVGLTDAEYALCPPGQAVADAGPSGPQRKRRRVPA